MADATIHVRLSDVAQKFMSASLDLLEVVEASDPALVSDRILAAANEVRAVIEQADREGI